MLRSTSWLLYAMVTVCSIHCGGSRDPLVEPTKRRPLGEAGAAASGAGAMSTAGGGQSGHAGTAGASIQTCSGLGAAVPEPGSLDANAFGTLRETGVAVGVAVSSSHLAEPQYSATVAREFAGLTPENELKWEATEPSPGQFAFAAADTIVRFAEQHQMNVHGHTLVWHSQLPYWVSQLSGADAVRDAMTRHIVTVMGHYRDEFPGRVGSWDVVNEALDSVDGVISYRDSPFYRGLGEGFIAEAFRVAHAADPDAQLYYNDYGIEGMGAKATATFEMLRSLVTAGVPISGVGFQMHTRAWNRGPTIADFEQNLSRYAAIGLPVNISEMDASICDAPGTESERLEQQRLRYNAIGAACLRSGICKSITVWGVADDQSWLNSGSPCQDPNFKPSPLLFDIALQRKPAWVGLRDALLGCYY